MSTHVLVPRNDEVGVCLLQKGVHKARLPAVQVANQSHVAYQLRIVHQVREVSLVGGGEGRGGEGGEGREGREGEGGGGLSG